MKDYLPYLIGALMGVLAALIISGMLTLPGTPQLMLFALLPVLGGAIVERTFNRRSAKS
ncbi:hypothetical protein [Rhizobium aegyptiacum]|uniref:hypothetical protein n=1 Tax=Rhizobium aegyptiacum TaxID=1764550 RepID=UPI000B306769|nr:hypothetical protein [Rhizobium aegyptiacum]